MTGHGPSEAADGPSEAAQRLVAALRAAGQTVAVAESLTGGLLCARLVAVPGVSAVLRGGVVSYATDLKQALLGVDGDLLRQVGAVHPRVAEQMADGVRARLGADWGVATTGVAGPQPQDGHPPGTVHVAVAGADGVLGQGLTLAGDRERVRQAAVDAALALLSEQVGVRSALGVRDGHGGTTGPGG